MAWILLTLFLKILTLWCSMSAFYSFLLLFFKCWCFPGLHPWPCSLTSVRYYFGMWRDVFFLGIWWVITPAESYTRGTYCFMVCWHREPEEQVIRSLVIEFQKSRLRYEKKQVLKICMTGRVLILWSLLQEDHINLSDGRCVEETGAIRWTQGGTRIWKDHPDGVVSTPETVQPPF